MTSSCALLMLCWINQGLALCSLQEGKAKGVETNESELLLCQAYVFVTVHLNLCPGTPQLYKSLHTSCNKPPPLLAWEGNSVGSWEGYVLVEMFRVWGSLYVQLYHQEVELSWDNPGTTGLRPGGVLRFQPSPGQVHHQHNISESCAFTLAWKSSFQCK